MIRDGLAIYFPMLGISSAGSAALSAYQGNTATAIICGALCVVATIATLVIHLTDRA